MKDFLKKLFWQLPISKELKEKIAQKRYQRILDKEDIYDAKGGCEIDTDPELDAAYIRQVVSGCKKKSPDYRAFQEHEPFDDDMTFAAFYLTQYHPNYFNDTWWGKGITEWNNVNQAVPQYLGHYQPRKPGELGYYDLRLKEVMQRQIELAKNYGIGAFCFYYYWFDGTRMLEAPLNLFLANQDLDMPFFYCWANENWTKKFTGNDYGVLIGVTQTKENYTRFIDAVLPDMLDSRYFTIDGKPVLSVYRADLLPQIDEVLTLWRQKAWKTIGKELYIIGVQSADPSVDLVGKGFDAESEFQPKQVMNIAPKREDIRFIRKDFGGKVYDYKALVEQRIYKQNYDLDRKVYPAAAPMWDNTPRRDFRGMIFDGSTPALYKQWLKDATVFARENKNIKNLVFLNAWNEWGEGAYLEPDEYFGYAYLEATAEARLEAAEEAAR